MITSQIPPQTYLIRNSAEGLQDSVFSQAFKVIPTSAHIENHCSKAHTQ